VYGPQELTLGPAQKRVLLRNMIGDSASALAHRPVRSVVQFTGRMAERLGARAVELAPGRLSAFDLIYTDPRLEGHFGGPDRPARLTLLHDSYEALDGLLYVITSATRRIDLMMYGWSGGPVGTRICNALAERADQGVQVRVLVDKTAYVIHNPGASKGEATPLSRLQCHRGVQLIFAPDPLVRFDHRKLAVADDRIAWSGSMILTDDSLTEWRNYNYLIEGPVVADLAAAFALRWQDVGMPGQPPVIPRSALVLPEGAANSCVHLIETNLGQNRSIKETIYHAVDHAKRSIWLENPYFSDEILVAKLVAAAKRGVDVRAILTVRGNIEKLNYFSGINANRLLKGGAHVYLYPAMTHVKAMTIDGVWAYIGTGNFDELSLRNNREIGISIRGAGVVREIEQTLFLADFAVSPRLCAPLPSPPGRLALEAFALWY
jgi:cardiolipin synthase